jgi:hypothetical protein
LIRARRFITQAAQESEVKDREPLKTASCDKILASVGFFSIRWTNHNMPTAKPKWGFISGYWVPMVSLDTLAREEFTRVMGHEPPPEFFASLEEIIGSFCGTRKFAKTMPHPTEIKAAIKYLAKETKKLAETLEKLDSYSRSLVRGARFRLDSSTGDSLGDCQNALLALSMDLQLALKRVPKLSGGAPRQSAKRNLGKELANLLDRFSIKLSSEQFECLLYLALNAAGETRGLADDTITKLARTARKRSR